MSILKKKATGGDKNNKGWFENEASLIAAYPTGQAGWFAVVVDSGKTIWIWDVNTSAWIDTEETGIVTSVNTKTGEVVITKEDIGLGEVDNTSDLDKPISTATQTELSDLDGRLTDVESDVSTLITDLTSVQSDVSDLEEDVTKNTAKLGNLVSFLDFGGVGDAMTNNYDALVAAANSGRSVYFPNGAYLVLFGTGVAPITLSAGTSFIGESTLGTIIGFACDSENIINIFSPSSKNLIQNINFGIAFSSENIVINLFYLGNLNTLRIKNIVFDGGLNPEATSTYSPNFSICSTDENDYAENFLMENCEIKNFRWLMLKSNEAQSGQENFAFINNRIIDMEKPATINSPNGLAKNFIFFRNTIIGNFSTDVGFRHLTGTAGGKDFKFVSNYLENSLTANDVLHFEEADNLVVVNNTIKTRGGGIGLLSNNIGGSDKSNKNIIIKDNIIEGVDNNRGLNYEGISFRLISLTFPSVEFCNVSGNIIRNFNNGFRGSVDAVSNIFANNIIEDCNIGLAIKEARATFENNMISNCDFGVQSISTGGGMIGKNNFHDCGNIMQSTGALLANSDGFNIIKKGLEIANNTTIFVDICELRSTSRISGVLSVSVISASNRQRFKTYNLSFSNPTFSAVEDLANGVGNIQIQQIILDSGIMKAEIRNTGGDAAKFFIDINFKGIYLN